MASERLRRSIGDPASTRRSIADSNTIVRAAEERLDIARHQVRRADATVRRMRTYIEGYDERWATAHDFRHELPSRR
jgi:hypothetical protein